MEFFSSKINSNSKININLSKIKLFAVLIFILIFSTVNPSKYCGHSKMKRLRSQSNSKTHTSQLIKVEYDKKDINTFKNLRIFNDFSGLESNNPESRHLAEKIKTEIIPKTMKILSELFKVRRIKRITLNEAMCTDEYKIPENVFKNKNIESDLIILVNYDKTGLYEENKIEASAIHCYQDFVTKRPIVGLVTFRDNLKIRTEVDIDYLVWLTLHEISHVLLFNEDLYPSFIDKNLKPRLINDIIYSEKNQHGQKVDYVKSPKVMKFAKKHYNCENIKGVPLEYNGGENAVGGHWSRRALNTDYMIGRSHGENLISPITLAFFEDSGWYKSDFKKSSIFFWGKNKGCDFITQNCVKSSKIINNTQKTMIDLLKKHEKIHPNKVFKKYRNSIEGDIKLGVENVSIKSTVIEVSTYFKKEFCEEINQPVCSMHNKFRGFCGAKLFGKDLPEKDRNFSNARIGGFDLFVNHCPIVVENKFDQKFYGGSCTHGSKLDLLAYEKIGRDSGCFVSNISKNEKTLYPFIDEKTAWSSEVYSMAEIKESRAACIEYTCERGEIYLKIDDKKIHCPSNKITKVSGYSGEIKCADKNVMCHRKYKCKFGCTNIQ
jgi:hypothetical protein